MKLFPVLPFCGGTPKKLSLNFNYEYSTVKIKSFFIYTTFLINKYINKRVQTEMC